MIWHLEMAVQHWQVISVLFHFSSSYHTYSLGFAYPRFQCLTSGKTLWCFSLQNLTCTWDLCKWFSFLGHFLNTPELCHQELLFYMRPHPGFRNSNLDKNFITFLNCSDFFPLCPLVEDRFSNWAHSLNDCWPSCCVLFPSLLPELRSHEELNDIFFSFQR